MKRKSKRNSEIFYPRVFGMSKEHVFQAIEERLERANAAPSSSNEYWAKYGTYDKRKLTKERLQWYVDEVARIHQTHDLDCRPYFLEYTLCILATMLEREDDEKTTSSQKVHSR